MNTVKRLRGTDADIARFHHTGSGLNVCQMGSQIAHMLVTTPEVVHTAEVALHPKDWLYLNLTGIRATDPSEACFTFGDRAIGPAPLPFLPSPSSGCASRRRMDTLAPRNSRMICAPTLSPA